MDNKPSIHLIDCVALTPYSYKDLESRSLGGTEATALRILEGLREDYSVSIYQAALKQSFQEKEIRFCPFNFKDFKRGPQADIVIILRNEKILPALRSHYINARFYLWMHCFPGKSKRNLGKICSRTKTKIISVSHTLKNFILDLCRKEMLPPEIEVIYNPIPDHLSLRHSAFYDKNKLLFLSSPHKGLEQVITNYRIVKKTIPELKLYIANPGYLEWNEEEKHQDIIFLGKLSHREVIRELSSAFCLFYPQSSFAETFGLVFAEANALGTPVLTHSIGSANEILNDQTQLVDANNPKSILERLIKWRNQGRPKVYVNPQFYFSNILRDWKNELKQAGNYYDRGKQNRTRILAAQSYS